MDWTAMIGLGAFHGINPGMGWLFAVALGMQQGRASGVWRALPPLALGHAVSVGLVVILAAFAQVVIPLDILQVAIATALVTLGAYRLWRHRHPRYGGMQVGFRDLTIWSCLMASAHGAGLMVLPFIMRLDSTVAAQDSPHHHTVMSTSSPWMDMMAVGVHSLTYLAVTTLIAWIVYRKIGLAILRTAWFNLDWLWAGALVITGIAIVLL
jgi:threonine/homoserine/homoserine lactone efflux protein